MSEFVARPARIANSTTRRFSTGRTPGIPRHTGQTLVFGGVPKAAEHAQKIFDRVSSAAGTSRPIPPSRPSCVHVIEGSWDGSWQRVPAMPVGRLLVRGADPEDGGLVVGLADHLESDGQASGIDAARHHQARKTC